MGNHIFHLGADGLFQLLKQRRRPDDAVFNDLGAAVGKYVFRQRVQCGGVAEHFHRLIKSTGQIFARRQINGGFSAHGRIHGSQQSGGNLQIGNSPLIRGGCKAGQITGDAAAQSHHGVGAGHAAFRQRIQQTEIGFRGFGGLAVGVHESDHAAARVFQTFLHPVGIQTVYNIAAHQQYGLAGADGLQLRTHPVQQTGINMNFIMPGGINGNDSQYCPLLP